MRDIEQKISPFVQGMFPSFYKEEGPNFIAFVQAYYEWLETNFQLLSLEDTTNFNVGDKVYQQDVTGTLVNYVGKDILVQIDGFNTFKCYNVCSELIPITSSSGGNTFIVTGGSTKRLSPIYMSRNLTKLRDIDKTLDLFIVNFKEKYLKNIEFDTSSNKQLLIKNSLDLYRSKGTERSIDLFFRLVYGIKASVEYPGERLFTLSAGEWYTPSYLEITSESVSRNIDLVGKQITGVTSGATAFVEKYIKRKVSSGFIHLLYISSIRGEFLKNELLRSDVAYVDSPKVLGSLSQVKVLTSDSGFKIGDTVSFTSSSGDKGLAKVTGIRDQNGTVDFELLDGGWGFTISSSTTSPYSETDRTQTLVSDRLLTLNSIETGNTVYSIDVTVEGSDYTDTDVVNIISPTVNATARIVTGGAGSIDQVILSNPGSGFFTTNPTIEILDSAGNPSAGVGASLSVNFTDPRQYFKILDTVEQKETNTTGILMYEAATATLLLSSVTDIIEVNDVLYQVGDYGESARARVTQVISSSLTSTQVKVQDISGVFTKNKPVYVLGRPITAQFNDISLVVGVANVSNAYSTTSNVVFKYAGTRAKFETQSTGKDANYEVAALSNPETIYLNTDLLNSNNVFGIPYMDVALSNISYGLPKNEEADVSSVIFSALQFEPFQVGSVEVLSDLNSGQDYSTDPKTLTYQPYLIGQQTRDYIIQIDNLSRDFGFNEIIYQTYNVNKAALDFDVALNVQPGEKIYIGDGGGISTSGIVDSINLAGDSIIISEFTGAIPESKNLYSYSNTTVNFAIIDVDQYQEELTAKAIVKQASSSTIIAKRIQYKNLFRYDLPLIGERSGATATIVQIQSDDSGKQIGFNSDVGASAASTQGGISTLRIIDSGFGYQQDQPLIFTSADGESSGTAEASTVGIGKGIGYYKTSKGFLSSLSKVHDGDYYQEYSYEVLSRIPIDKYATMFKKVMHTAGTRFFGSVLLDSLVDKSSSVISSSILEMEGSPYIVTTREPQEVQDRSNMFVEIRE